MSEKLFFKAQDEKFNDILFSNEKFQIPRFQRPYARSDDQVLEFWNDLTTSTVSYFIGSFIFNREGFEKTGTIEIIDGQQRMLTATIFMAVLRDLARELGDSTRAI